MFTRTSNSHLPDVDTSSIKTNDSEERKIITSLHKYYINSSSNNSIINHSPEDTRGYMTKNHDQKISCQICFDKTCDADNFIILSCNHVFHICCLTDKQYDDMYKHQMLDSEYFSTRTCFVCCEKLQTEEMMFLHSKFLNSTKDKISHHNDKIKSLEEKMKNVKEELIACYDYKNKLEHEREKSKQIVATLVTLI